MDENLRVDHVIYGVRDIDAAADRLLAERGLASVPGGRHEGRGTGNRIVPLGSSYLELMGVVDADEAAVHPFGQWFSAQIAHGDRFITWCVGTDDIEHVAERLGLAVEPWTRATPDGGVLRWRLAGLELTFLDPSLPFFIQWDLPEQHPSHQSAPHRVQPSGYALIDLAGDPARIENHLGGAELPVSVDQGDPAVRSVVIATDQGDIEIR
jgi:hypothetical protein